MQDQSLRGSCSRRCARARQLRNSTTPFSRQAGKLSSLSNRISARRSDSQMKALIKSRPRKKRKSEAGETRLPSNYLLIHISTEQYPPSTGNDSSWKIAFLEFLVYSEPICSSLVRPTQAWMGILWTYPQTCHGGSQVDNFLFVQ